MEDLVSNNLLSIGWFRPELALTFGALALFLLDLVWRRSPSTAGWWLTPSPSRKRPPDASCKVR